MGVRIAVMFNVTSNIDQALSWTQRLSPQMDYAVARSLTGTVREIAQAMPGVMESVFDKPTEWSKKGVYTLSASKSSKTAVVGIKDRQASYLQWQVEGGTRAPRNKALRLPSVVDLNAHGNLPAGLIKRLIERAKAGKRATKAQGKRYGVSSKVDLFYGDPGDGRPVGIYKRVQAGKRSVLVPIVVMPQRGARYERRFDFYGQADRIARRVYPAQLAAAWAEAMRTAR